MASQPFNWTTAPASWAELGKRTFYEIAVLAPEHCTGGGSATPTTGDIARALDRAMRATTPLESVTAWATTKASDVPELAA